MLKYFISTFLFIQSFFLFAQEDNTKEQKKDTLKVYKQKYGLRAGFDAGKIIRTLVDDNYKGFEINGDFRISRTLYVAAEIGTEEKITNEDLYNFKSSGSFLKVGVDINTYENWYGMENLIFIGFRVASSTFKHKINDYRIYNTNQYWDEGELIGSNENILGESDSLSAVWLEIILGLKAEIFTNLFIGAGVQLHYLASEKAVDNFPNLYIPGYNKTTSGSKFGVGYNYNISYLIPIFKKAKKKKKKQETEEDK